MSSVINTNTLSLLTQNNLTKSQSALNTSIQRLSSGLRINSAKDDAAGQAIANRFTANIKGLTQASRNANDGISLAQTTEGALNEINTNLQRIRELTVQSANASNSPDDKTSIQAEITQRLEEINRTSQQTDFNGVKVLSAKADSLKIQVGANDGETISIGLREISSNTLGLTGFDAGKIVSSAKVGTAITSGTAFNVIKAAVVQANTFVPAGPTPGAAMAAAGVYKLSTPIVASGAVSASGQINYSTASGLTAAGAVTTGADQAVVSYVDGGVTKYAAVDATGTATKAVALTANSDGTFTAGADLTATPAEMTKVNAAGQAVIADGSMKTAAVSAAPAVTAVDYAVKGADGNYYGLATNPVTNALTWDSGSTAIAASSVDATAAVSTVDVKNSNVPTALTVNNGTIAGGVTITNFSLYKRNDVAPQALTSTGAATPPSGELTGYAMKASDGKFYGVTLSSATNGTDPKAWVLTAKVDASAMKEVSDDNVGVAVSDVIVGTTTVASNADLKNVAINPGAAVTAVPTASGVFATTATSSGYAVKGSDNKYYAATVANGTGNVSWNSSSTDLTSAMSVAEKAATAVLSVKDGTTAAATFVGLAAGETLHALNNEDGTASGNYVVKGGTTDAPTYKNATLSAPDATGNVTVTKTTAATVDPLAMIDRALANVDTLRGALGAVQNRFDSVISNLGSTITNLSSSRSRIEDADYATEVSNMTRAQILQQAGTSVLAKANQSTQGVMSLLQ